MTDVALPDTWRLDTPVSEPSQQTAAPSPAVVSVAPAIPVATPPVAPPPPPAPSEDDPEALSLESEPSDTSLGTAPMPQAVEPADVLSAATVGEDNDTRQGRFSVFRFNRQALLLTGAMVLLMLLVGSGAWLLFGGSKDQAAKGTPATDYAIGSKLSVEGVQASPELAVGQADLLTVNGRLQVRDTLIVSPTSTPSKPQEGQIYYDKNNNTLYYYNGTQFVGLAPQTSVTSLGGVTGAISLGDGLSINGGRLTVSNVLLQQIAAAASSGGGVTSLQGQTGDVQLTAGPGISINGTTIGNSGVLGLASGSANLTVTDDGSGHYTVSAATASGISGSGTAGNIPKFNGPNSVADSGLSEAGSTLTYVGNLVVNTASGFSGNLINLEVGGSSKLTVDQAGNLIQAGNLTVNGTGGSTIAGSLSVGSGLAVNGGGASIVGNSTINGVLSGLTGLSSSGTITFGGLNSPGVVHTNASGVLSTSAVVLGTDTSGDYVARLGTLTGLSTTGNSGSNSTPTLSVNYGSASGTAVQGNTTLTCAAGSGNLSGGGNTITLGAGGSCGNISITNSPVFTGTLAAQGAGGITVGVAGNTGGVINLANGTTGFLTTLRSDPVNQNQIIAIPDSGAASDEVCLRSLGNCVGAGGGVTTVGGTNGTIAMFTGSNTIANSILSQSGTSISVGGDLTASGTVAAGYLQGNGSGLTDLDAGNVSTGILADSHLSNNVAKLNTNNNFTGSSLQHNGNDVCDASNNCDYAAASGSSNYIWNGTVAQTADFNITGSGTVGTLSVTNGATVGSLAVTGNATVGGTINTAVISGGSLASNSVNGLGLTNSAISASGALNINAGGTNQNLTLQGSGNGSVIVQTPTFHNANGATYSFSSSDVSSATATICTTLGNCAGAGGGIVGSGTAGQVAYFNGTGSIASDSGFTYGSGNLTVSGALQGNKLSLTSGSNTLSLQAGTMSSNLTLYLPTADGGNGDCLMTDGSGNLSFQSCTGGAGGGVTSLNGLVGVLTLNNASGSGSHITINDASTTQKGIAQFDSTNFQASSGVVNTVQNINSTATPTFSGLTLSGLNTAGVVHTDSAGALSTSAVILGTETSGNYIANLGTLTGLTATGNIGAGSTPSLSVKYGATANTAVQGNTSITCTGVSGSNLSGGGNSLTLGSGGSCNSISLSNSPTFSGTLTVQGAGGITVGTAGTTAGKLTLATTGTGSVSLAPAGSQAGNYTVSIPILTANDTLCLASAHNCTATGTAGGDLSGNYPNPTVVGIQNTPVSFTALSSGDILQYNGSNIVNGKITNSNFAANTQITNLTGVGALSSGSIGGAFGTIATNSGISTSSTLQGGTLNVGSSNQLQIDASGNLTTSGTAAIRGSGGLTLGVAGNTNGVLKLANSSNTNLSFLQSAAPSGTGNATYTLPSINGGNSDELCLKSLGNCAGAGGIIGGGGTAGHLAIFTAANTIGNSQLTESATTLTYAGNVVVNAATGFSGNLINLEVNGSSKLSVNQGGDSVQAGTLTVNGTGASSVAGTLSVGTLGTNGTVSLCSNAGVISSCATSGSGTQGWWTRSGTTLQPVNAGDNIQTSGAISTTGTGAITSAGVLNANATGKTAISIADSGTQNSGITIGGDTNLYRGTSGQLNTDGSLFVNGNIGVGGTINIQGNALTTSSSSFSLLNTTATTLNFGGAATTLNIGPGGSSATSINLAGGSGATGCTIDGTTGNLTCTGTVTGSNTTNLWTRTGTTLQPANAGDNINTSGTYQIGGTAVLQVVGATNFFVGPNAGNLSVTGSANTGAGYGALSSVAGSSNNTALGTYALNNTTTGGGNTAVGTNALQGNTSGYSNTAIGINALKNNTTGHSNIVIGENSGGNLTTGSGNILIGSYINAPSASSTGQLNIGNAIYGDLQNGSIWLQNSSNSATAFQIQTAGPSSQTLLNADTTNNTITVTGNAGSTGTQTFNYTGSSQTFTVPAGVTSINVTLYGAQGGTGYGGAAGGAGGQTTGTISVTPGQVLTIIAGGQGGNGGGAGTSATGGYGGGGSTGASGTGYSTSGGGGGMSAISSGGTYLAIAGGGGGGATAYAYVGGVGGGLTGGATSGGSGRNGGGGTQSAGGTVNIGYVCDTIPPTTGSAYQGGTGGSGPGYSGGGGGGGYYGGGGGDCATASGIGTGGGGSALVPSGGTTTSGVQSGNGQVAISWSAVYASALTVKDTSGNTIFDVNPSTSLVTVGTPSGTPALLVLGAKNTSGDPTCVNGGMYYNTTSNQAKICLGGSWAAVGVPTVTTLPGSPSDGDEVYYKVYVNGQGSGNTGYWHLRYNASTTYWDFLGGPALYSLDGTVYTNSSPYNIWKNSNAVVYFPLNGDYDLTFGSQLMQNTSTGLNQLQIGLYYNGTSTVITPCYYISTGQFGSASEQCPFRQTGITGAGGFNRGVQVQYMSYSNQTSTFYPMFVGATPIRVK